MHMCAVGGIFGAQFQRRDALLIHNSSAAQRRAAEAAPQCTPKQKGGQSQAGRQLMAAKFLRLTALIWPNNK